MSNFITRNKGFTLIEVAVVLLIIGFILGAVLTPMGAQRENINIKQARQEIKAIEEAIYGFTIAIGRMPCPAQPGGGTESPAGGLCTSASGFVPSASLGIDGRVNCDGLLLDPWGNPYRYSVTQDDANGANGPDFTTASEIILLQPSGLQPDIQICTDSACGTNLTGSAVAVIFSMGSNWNTLGGADETQNAGEANIGSTCGLGNYGVSNDRDYVSHDRIETGANQFNDIVSWVSPNILYAKLLAAGIL